MDLKKRNIISWIITAAIGGVLLIFREDSVLFSMGIAMIFATIVRAIRFIPIFANEEKYEKLKKVYNDERNIYISRKSYSMSFCISAFAALIAMIILRFLHYEQYSIFLGYVICAQLLIYLIVHIIYRRLN